MSASGKGQQLFSRFKISQKISSGYAIALGIAVGGTAIGLGIGSYYQQKAVHQEKHAEVKIELLQRLQTSILQARTHQQQLIPLIANAADFQAEYIQILEHRQHIERHWANLESFVESESNSDYRVELLTFLQTYESVPETFLAQLDHLVSDIESDTFESPTFTAQRQRRLLDLTNSDLARQFDRISDELVLLLDLAYAESLRTEQAAQQLGQIAQSIVIGSMALSIAIAAVLAVAISRAISRPIQSLNRTAKQATKTANFTLQAQINSQDEIGTLAQSFNQLIDSVQDLLAAQKIANEQLASYSETLEQTVASRTQELQEKNQQLESLLTQLRQSQSKIIQSEKMSSLGQLVAGVAHEINNPVNFIHGNLIYLAECLGELLNFISLYQEHYPHPIPTIQAQADAIDIDFLQADLPKLLNSMQAGTERIRYIVISLRNFSRTDEARLKTVDVHEGLESTLTILQHRLKAKLESPAIEIVRVYGALPRVECYPGQLNQVFMNILTNAIDALEEQQTTAGEAIHPAQVGCITLQTSVINDQWIQISIKDNGPGIPEAIQSKIFEPFFTTKPVGSGTGLGVSISYQIIAEKHGGELRCISAPGEGTQFILQLPTHQKKRHITEPVTHDLASSKPALPH